MIMAVYQARAGLFFQTLCERHLPLTVAEPEQRHLVQRKVGCSVKQYRDEKRVEPWKENEKETFAMSSAERRSERAVNSFGEKARTVSKAWLSNIKNL